MPDDDHIHNIDSEDLYDPHGLHKDDKTCGYSSRYSWPVRYHSPIMRDNRKIARFPFSTHHCNGIDDYMHAAITVSIPCLVAAVSLR